MSLSKLPVETLAQIVHILGHDFFRKDLGRLTLWREWYAIAQDEIHTHVAVGVRDFDYFFDESGAHHRIPPVLPSWASEKVQTLEFNVEGEVDEVICFDDDDRKPPTHCILHRMSQSSASRVYRLLEQLRRLRALTLNISIESGYEYWDSDIAIPLPDCGRIGTVLLTQIASLNLPHLRELNLSIPLEGSFFGLLNGQDHVCWRFNDLLGQLRTLKVVRLDLVFLCPVLLMKNIPDGSLLLETLLVECDNDTSPWFLRSMRCDGIPDAEHVDEYDDVGAEKQVAFNELAKDLAAAAKNFSRAMKTPKVVRVLWPNELAVEPSSAALNGEDKRAMFGWDCLTDEVRTFRKPKGWEWGTPVDLDEELERWNEALSSTDSDSTDSQATEDVASRDDDTEESSTEETDLKPVDPLTFKEMIER